jgi:8-oxo-dGTP diphosphatase
MPNTAVERLAVAIGIIRDAERRVLIAQRAGHRHQGGLWEFPGGKIEAGESAAAALGRELREELALDVLACRPLLTLDHDYPDLAVRLEVREVTQFRGEAVGCEGQALVWAPLAELARYPMPAPNRAIIAVLTA